MSAKKSKSAKELIRAARLPERTVRVCTRGDLVADIEGLESELRAEVEKRATDGRLASKSRINELADAIEAKRGEMDESTITFRLRAMKPADWREMARKYPAKDANMPVDVLALMGEAIPACTIEPEGLDPEDWEALNDNAAPAELGKLIDAVWELHTQGVDVPKSRLASAVNRRNSDD